MRTSFRLGPANRSLDASRKRFARSQVATVWQPFTLFEVRGINFAIVVYSECMHIGCRFALSQLFEIHGEEHG
jgi:hypothetical protein